MKLKWKDRNQLSEEGHTARKHSFFTFNKETLLSKIILLYIYITDWILQETILKKKIVGKK